MRMPTVAVALAACLAWAVLIVAVRVVLLQTGVNAWAFSLVQLVSSGAFMVGIALRGRVSWGAFAHLGTWIYGGLRVIAASCASAALLYVGVMQDTLLAMINVPLAALAVLAWTGRRPMRWQWAGHGAIVAGIALLAAHLPGGFANPAVILELIAESAVAISTVLIERHPYNRSNAVADRCLFTGIVLLVTAVLFLLAWLSMGAAGLSVGRGALALGDLGLLFGAPGLWLWGCLVGALLRGPTMYLALWAIARSGTVTYLATLALLPIVGLALEWLVSRWSLLPPPSVSVVEIAAGSIVLAGSLLLVRLRSQ